MQDKYITLAEITNKNMGVRRDNINTKHSDMLITSRMHAYLSIKTTQ